MKVQKVRKLFSLLLALVLVFSAIAIPIQAEAQAAAIAENSAYLEQLYYERFSEPDNPIVSQEPYPRSEEELATFEADGQCSTTLLTYADGSTSLASAIPVNTSQSSKTRASIPDFLVYSINGDGKGNITISLASTILNVGN